MGQYFVAANIDKKESYFPDGAKFIEHSWITNYCVEFIKNEQEHPFKLRSN